MSSKTFDVRNSLVVPFVSYVDGDQEGNEKEPKRKCSVPLDLTLLIGSQKVEVQCHRSKLPFHSEMFLKLLNGDFAESKSDEVLLPLSGLLCGDEPDAETFKKWIKAIYSGVLELDTNSVLRMLDLMNFLIAPDLLEYCLDYMIETISNDTIFAYLECARRVQTLRLDLKWKKLDGRLEEYLMKNIADLVSNDVIQALSKQTFIDLILAHNVQVEEIELFKAVVKWSDLRQDGNATSELLSYIRYATISTLLLSDVVWPTRLVSDVTLIEAYRYQSFLSAREFDKAKQMTDGDVTGNFLNRMGFPGTTLLNECNMSMLTSYLGASKATKLLFKASQHGYRSADFHRHCDNKGATFIVVKRNGSETIFGGYTPLNWTSTAGFKTDDQMRSFLFTTSDDNGRHAKYQHQQSPTYAIYCNYSPGPIFGHSNLSLCDNFNTISTHCSREGGAYQLPSTTSLCGQHRGWSVEDLEVFQVE